MEKRGQTTAVLGIGTAVPPFRIDQEEASQKLVDALKDDPTSARWVRRIFRQCGVDERYTCEAEFLYPAERCRYLSPSAEETPTTSERMAKFREQAAPLGAASARKAVVNSGLTFSEITHLITVSCTGLFLPGLDTALIHELGLDAGIGRLPLSFLGCAAGMTALRLAKELVQGDPSAKVLVVSVELCTLHIQPAGGRETLFASAFFGDGAAACVVGWPTGEELDGVFALGDHRTAIFPGSAGEMTWEVGSHGFDLRLSPQIPKRIGEFVPGQIERLLGGEPLPELWAIHPGGRGIVDAMQTIYRLTDEQVGASRSVLRRFGNLSSATIFFVLEEMRHGLKLSASPVKEGIALAFGPGLNAELMRISYVPPGVAAGGSIRSEARA